MPEPISGLRLFTVEEANAALPRVAALLKRLKGLRKLIVELQARVDIEEFTGGASAAVERLLKEIEAHVHGFHAGMEEFRAIGCELKDLDQGLVDFYGIQHSDVVCLCWKEGEEKVSHWHRLDAGFQGRQKLGE